MTGGAAIALRRGVEGRLARTVAVRAGSSPVLPSRCHYQTSTM